MSLRCKICGFEHDSNLIDHIEESHADIAIKDQNLDALEAYFLKFNVGEDEVVIELTLREELNLNLGLNIPDHSDLDFMKPKVGPDGKLEKLLWYDIVYQDEELMERFLIQMADHNAPPTIFRKYAKEMFGEDYWMKVNELSKAHKSLLPYREGDDGGGIEYMLWCEEEGERMFETFRHILINAKDFESFKQEVRKSLNEAWVENAQAMVSSYPELKFVLEKLIKESGGSK